MTGTWSPFSSGWPSNRSNWQCWWTGWTGSVKLWRYEQWVQSSAKRRSQSWLLSLLVVASDRTDRRRYGSRSGYPSCSPGRLLVASSRRKWRTARGPSHGLALCHLSLQSREIGRYFTVLNDTCPHASWKERMMVTKSVGQSILSRISQRAIMSTESNAFVRTTKTAYISRCCSRHFSCSCLAVNIISMVLRPVPKPHWLSGNMPISSTCLDSRLGITRPSILPGIDSKEIPRWSLHTERSPFRLKMCTISASLNSCGTDRLFQMFWKRWVCLVMRFRPPALNTSAGRPSTPGALPDTI